MENYELTEKELKIIINFKHKWIKVYNEKTDYMDRKKDSTICCLQETCISFKGESEGRYSTQMETTSAKMYQIDSKKLSQETKTT